MLQMLPRMMAPDLRVGYRRWASTTLTTKGVTTCTMATLFTPSCFVTTATCLLRHAPCCRCAGILAPVRIVMSDSGPTFDRVVGLDRCDDCELGSNGTPRLRCASTSSRWLGHWQRRPVALCLKTVLRWYWKSVATSQSDSVSTDGGTVYRGDRVPSVLKKLQAAVGPKLVRKTDPVRSTMV
jgi:hypothetical protein